MLQEGDEEEEEDEDVFLDWGDGSERKRVAVTGRGGEGMYDRLLVESVENEAEWESILAALKVRVRVCVDLFGTSRVCSVV